MRVKGSVTVFLSLLISLFLVLVQCLTFGLTIQNGKNYRKADTVRAVECVFAEYQKNLWDNYGILAIDGNYEKQGQYTVETLKKNVRERIGFYDGGMLSHQVSDIRLLSDESGAPLRSQILRSMEKKYGVGVLEDTKEKENALEQSEKDKANAADDLDRIKEQFETVQGKEPEEGENPLKKLASIFSGSLLGLVFPKDQSLSANTVDLRALPSERNRLSGNGLFSEVEMSSELLEKAYIGAYIRDHFHSVTSKDKGTGGIEYEVEYLLAGQESDEKNLESTVGELVLLRFFPNYIYIQQDEAKKAEAKAAATALCILLLIPEMTDALSQVLLAVWSYAEAVLDIKTLLAGGRVPFEKSQATWKLSLSGIWNIGDSQVGDQGEGWVYEDYLQLLFLKEKSGVLNMRMLDLIELNLKERMGCTFFRADACICAMKVKSTGILPGDITYRFETQYAYE